jgi:uncharacterized ion transporter superfamily protein YfcC
MKKKFSFPTAYTIAILAIVFVAVLTWIMPTGSYNYRVDGTDKVIPAAQVHSYHGDKKLLPVPDTYTEMPGNPQGFFSIVEAPIEGFYESVGIILFVIVIGGFLGIIMKTGAIDAGIALVIEKLKGKEGVMIVILMCILALGGTTFSMGEETLAFYPVLIPVMLVAGYDSVVAFLVLVLGTQTGCLAALVSPFSTGIASRFIGVGVGDGMGLRVVLLVVILVINIMIVLLYATKVKKNPAFSLVADKKEELEEHYLHGIVDGKFPEFNGKRRMVITLFLLTFAIYIYGILPFDSLGITILPTWGWSFLEMTALFGVSGVIIGFLYGMKEKEIVDNFMSGACDLLGVAIIIGLARGITVIMEHGLIIDTVLYWSSLAIKGFSSVVCINIIYLVHIILSFLIPSTSGLAAISMPIMGPLATFKAIPKDLVVTAYMAASGIVNFITPTSAIVMGGLVIARFSYAKYLKFIVPRLLIVLLASMLLLSLGLLFS